MRKVQLNTQLISVLPKVLRCTNAEIEHCSGIKDATFRRILKDPKRITMNQLLALSNSLQVPARRFFTPADFDYVGQREDYIVSYGYQKCYYDDDAVRKILGFGKNHTFKEVGEALGITPSRVAPKFFNASRMLVQDYLNFCESFYIYPFTYVIDPNPENPVLLGKKPQPDGGSAAALALARRIESATKQEVMRLTGEVESLRAKLADVIADYDKLFRKMREMNQTQDRIVHSIGVKIDTVQNNYIAMAAEDKEGEYGQAAVPK